MSWHGQPGGYARHYREDTPVCEACQEVHNRYMRRYRKGKTLGRQHSLPVERVRQHIEMLGYSQRVLAERSGLAIQTVKALYDPRRKVVRAATARAILSLRPPRLEELPRTMLIPAVGTSRRLQALAWQGWSLVYVAQWISEQRAELGRPKIHAPALVKAIRAERVTVATAQDVDAAYHALASRRAPDSPSSRRARAHAIQAGWAPAAAWDDFDNPNERPKGIAS